MPFLLRATRTRCYKLFRWVPQRTLFRDTCRSSSLEGASLFRNTRRPPVLYARNSGTAVFILAKRNWRLSRIVSEPEGGLTLSRTPCTLADCIVCPAGVPVWAVGGGDAGERGGDPAVLGTAERPRRGFSHGRLPADPAQRNAGGPKVDAVSGALLCSQAGLRLAGT